MATGRQSGDEPCGHTPRTLEPRRQIQGRGALLPLDTGLPSLSGDSSPRAQLHFTYRPPNETRRSGKPHGITSRSMRDGRSLPESMSPLRACHTGSSYLAGHFSALSGVGMAARKGRKARNLEAHAPPPRAHRPPEHCRRWLRRGVLDSLATSPARCTDFKGLKTER